MGLLDKIFDGIKEEIKSELSKLANSNPSAVSETEAVPNETPRTDYEPPRIYNTGDEHFAAIITDKKFPGYTIEQSVHPSIFDTSAHPRCYPISYLFRKDGAPVLAVLVMNRNQSRAMIAVGTYTILDDNKIPYIRFYKGMENNEDYVVNRIRDNLI